MAVLFHIIVIKKIFTVRVSVNDCCLMPNKQFFSCIMMSYIWWKW